MWANFFGNEVNLGHSKNFTLVNLDLSHFLRRWILTQLFWKRGELMVNLDPTNFFKRWTEVKTWGGEVQGGLWRLHKGALDKYNIYLFISNSIQDLESNQYRKFQLIPLMRFHFMRYFVNSIIFRVPPYAAVLCIYWSRLRKIENARNIHIFSKVSQSRM